MHCCCFLKGLRYDARTPILLKKLLNRYGIYSETLQKGKMAKLYSTNKPFTPEEKKKFIQIIKEMYSEFLLADQKEKVDGYDITLAIDITKLPKT